jgi:hypothetical protein
MNLFKKKTDAPAAPKEPVKAASDPNAPRTAPAKGLGSFFGGSSKAASSAAAPSKPVATTAAKDKDKPISRSNSEDKRCVLIYII